MLTIAGYAPSGATLPYKQGLRRPLTILATSQSFSSFLPRQVENIKDPYGRKLASRIQRLPVNLDQYGRSIMSSVVKPFTENEAFPPLLLLHGFDSSCLEWRYTLPLLDEGGLESWAVDVLGWGFSDLGLSFDFPTCYAAWNAVIAFPFSLAEIATSFDVASKRNHLYQLWRTYIKKPVVLVGPSLGAAVAIDFATNHPDAVDRLILVDASVYAKETGSTNKWLKTLAYAGVYVLKSLPLRVYGTFLAINNLSLTKLMDYVKMGRLHCLYPWWEDATVDFMMSGGYNVCAQIKKVKQPCFIIWGEDDNVINNKEAERLQSDLQDAIVHKIPNCGHLPHVEKPHVVAKLIMEFIMERSYHEQPLS